MVLDSFISVFIIHELDFFRITQNHRIRSSINTKQNRVWKEELKILISKFEEEQLLQLQEIFENQTFASISLFIFCLHIFGSTPCAGDLKHLPLEAHAPISEPINLKKRYLLFQKKQQGLEIDFTDRRDFKKIFRSPDLLTLPWLNLDRIQEMTKDVPRKMNDLLPGKRGVPTPKSTFL